MKRSIKFVILMMLGMILVACDNATERSSRTVNLIQENVTSIVNELTEIQLLENNLQSDFEATLSDGADMAAFLNEDALINQNLSNRKEHLQSLDEQLDNFRSLSEELSNQAGNSPLSEDQINSQVTLMNDLSNELQVYIDDYMSNLELETQIFQHMAEPELDIDDFYAVFDQAQTLYTTNHINLEKTLEYFEPINANLINFKVFLVNLAESED